MSIIIDGITFNVPIQSLEETCDFLDKYAERTEDGVLHRELIGCYFNQSLTFGQINDTVAYTALWNKLTEAVTFHEVVVPDNDGIPFTFTAYMSQVRRTLRKVTTSKTYWKQITVNFIAQSPALTP